MIDFIFVNSLLISGKHDHSVIRVEDNAARLGRIEADAETVRVIGGVSADAVAHGDFLAFARRLDQGKEVDRPAHAHVLVDGL